MNCYIHCKCERNIYLYRFRKCTFHNTGISLTYKIYLKSFQHKTRYGITVDKFCDKILKINVH